MIETIIVLLIVAGSAAIIGRKFYKTLTGKGGCGCAGASSCGKKPGSPSCCGSVDSIKH